MSLPLRRLAWFFLLAGVVPAFAVPLEKTPAEKPNPDRALGDLARNVVEQGARVRAGDLVRILGSPADLAILEELAVHSRKLGAQPLITVQSDRLERRFYEE